MHKNNRVLLITGATGFVGRRLCEVALGRGMPVRRALRHVDKDNQDGVFIGDIGPETDWSEALKGATTVVHLAARVHVTNDKAGNPEAKFRRVNVEGTANLARQAAQAGAQRFVFISSIKVHGESSLPGQPFNPEDPPAPQEPYARSKYEAERALHQVSAETGLEVAIIRPPLVYGPGVKANFMRMMAAIRKGLPLPLGAVHNKRSLVALDNLVDLICTCIDHPAAAGQTFLVSDGADLSTPALLRKLAAAMDCRARIVPVPTGLLHLAGRITKKSTEVEKLISSLQVDISHTCKTLNWRPPVPVDKAIRDTAKNFVRER